MKLYHKKISSLEALKRERIRLKYERRTTNSKDFLPVREFKNNNNAGGTLSLIMGALNSKSSLQTLSLLSGPLLKALNKKAGRNVLLSGLTSVVGGFVKWKLVEMGYRGIKMFVKAQRKKRAKAQMMKMH